MNLERIEAFVSIARQGQLGRAALSLALQASILSRRLSALERECGGPLFYRTGRGMTLSPLGERLLPHAEALLEQAHRFSDEVKADAGTVRGDVRIGVVSSLTQPLLVPLYIELREKYPAIRLLTSEGASDQLDAWRASGTIDISVLFRHGRAGQPDEQAICKVDNYLMGPPGDSLTGGPTVPFRGLEGIPLMLPGLPNGFRVRIDQIARRVGIHLNVPLEANNLNVQIALTAQGCGYTIMAAHAASQQVGQGILQASLIVQPRFARTITLGIATHRPPSAAVREVARVLRRIAQRQFS